MQGGCAADAGMIGPNHAIAVIIKQPSKIEDRLLFESLQQQGDAAGLGSNNFIIPTRVVEQMSQ